jgi:hypothetical protein
MYGDISHAVVRRGHLLLTKERFLLPWESPAELSPERV